MIFIENKKRKIERIEADYPNADILDITSTSPKRYSQILSPFYPHGNIPVPFSPGVYATCVEAIWQGLKVFENQDVDISLFSNNTMKNLKRTVRKFGKPLGHRKGVNGKELLSYFDARMMIYMPTYKWVLENIPEVKNVINRISERAKTNDVVLLDYNTNIEFRDITSPLSHAGLIKLYIEGKYPKEGEKFVPLTKEESKIIKEKIKKEKKENKKQNVQQLNLFS